MFFGLVPGKKKKNEEKKIMKNNYTFVFPTLFFSSLKASKGSKIEGSELDLILYFNALLFVFVPSFVRLFVCFPLVPQQMTREKREIDAI